MGSMSLWLARNVDHSSCEVLDGGPSLEVASSGARSPLTFEVYIYTCVHIFVYMYMYICICTKVCHD